MIAQQCEPAAGRPRSPPVAEEHPKRIDALGKPIDLEVDGGINVETAPVVVAAGADALVAGTATFNGGKAAYPANIRRLRGSKD